MIGSQGLRPRGYEPVLDEGLREVPVSSGLHESVPTETSPLIQREGNDVPLRHEEKPGTTGCWIVQMLFAVPFPVILFTHVVIIILGGMSQTLTDGSSPASGKICEHHVTLG